MIAYRYRYISIYIFFFKIYIQKRSTLTGRNADCPVNSSFIDLFSDFYTLTATAKSGTKLIPQKKTTPSLTIPNPTRPINIVLHLSSDLVNI